MSATALAEVAIAPAPPDFSRWDELLALIVDAFAYMDGVIDPPSSAKRLTPASLAERAAGETLLLATRGDEIVGCLFAAERADCVYVGKLAVRRDLQGTGLGRRLLAAAEKRALGAGKPVLELQTRIELTGNQAAFARLGFRETARTAHAGFDRPTTITMRKELRPGG